MQKGKHSKNVITGKICICICCFIYVLPACNGTYSEKNNADVRDKDSMELRIAKTVPLVYYPVDDAEFQKHQDTVYFQKKLFTGFQYQINDSGDTISLNSYFNGVEEGLQKKWFVKGVLQETRFYINGKKEGMQEGWWPDGKKRFEFSCYNGEYEGEFREWAMNGILIKDFHYHKGYETGSQRLWWSDGKVRANYVIKNGKKYGLLGYKICANPYDSVKSK